MRDVLAEVMEVLAFAMVTAGVYEEFGLGVSLIVGGVVLGLLAAYLGRKS